MKRILIAAVMALTLAGCAGVDLAGLADPAVRITETMTDEKTSTAKGATAGMSSSDAATTLISRDYYSTLRSIHGASNAPARPLVEIEAHDDRPITIDAKVFRVYSPPTAPGGAASYAIAPPQKVESTGIKWFREVRQAAAEIFIPWYKIDNDNELGKLNIVTNADLQRFIAQNDSNLLRDLVGTRNDLATLDRAEADRIRLEANRATTPD